MAGIIKTVVVEVIRSLVLKVGVEDDEVFEVSYTSTEGVSDQSVLLESLKKKSVELKQAISASSCSFKKESTVFKGKYVQVGDESPFKEGCMLRCYLKPIVPMNSLDSPGIFLLNAIYLYILHIMSFVGGSQHSKETGHPPLQQVSILVSKNPVGMCYISKTSLFSIYLL